jgi:hypothetical protein
MCEACPWRDMDAMVREHNDVVLFAAHHPDGFVCHTRMGPCDGPKFILRRTQPLPKSEK